jgi:hypothetical protein
MFSAVCCDSGEVLINIINETYVRSLSTMHMIKTFLRSGVLIALGSLTLWHARLISRGETSIEANINKAETKRLAEKNKVIVYYLCHVVIGVFVDKLFLIG